MGLKVYSWCGCCWGWDIKNSLVSSDRYGCNLSLVLNKVDSEGGVDLQLPEGTA